MLHKIVDQHGNVYKGEVLRGKRHGRGTIVYADTRDVYQGDFENDVPHGAGRYYRAGAENGLFEGLWKDGELYQVKKGHACIEDSNGDHYDGGFDHWKRHGKGILKSANGDLYEGYWKQGLRHGYGILQYKDGTKFEGQFKIDEPFAPSSEVDDDDDCDDKTVATTASEFETMDLNPYPITKIEADAEEKEITRSSLPNEGRDSGMKKKTPEQRREKIKTKTINEDEVPQKQHKKGMKDVKRKLELLERAKAEKKGQFQRDRKKYLLDAKKDIEKKRLKESESGSSKKLGKTEKASREKSDDSEKASKHKNGLLKRFQRERSKETIPEYIDNGSCTREDKETRQKDETKIDDDRQSCSIDGKIETRVNHQQDVTGTGKHVYSSSRPPAYPLLSNIEKSWSLSPSRGRATSRNSSFDSRKRPPSATSATSKTSKSTKNKKGSKKDRETLRGAKRDKNILHITNRGRSRSTISARKGERSPSPFFFFRSRSKSSSESVNTRPMPPQKPKKEAERGRSPSNMSRSSRARSKASTKASYHSSQTHQSHQSHTLEMLGSSSDSNDPNFVKTSNINLYQMNN